MRFKAFLVTSCLLLAYAAAEQTNKQGLGSEEAKAAKDRLHKSLALPSSYKDAVKPAAAAPKPTPAAGSKPVTGKAAAATAKAAAAAAPEPASTSAAGHTGVPCPHPEHQHHHRHAGRMSSFGRLFDMPTFSPFLAEAARDVFGIEQAITNRMNHVFEDIISQPAFPSVFDILEQGPVLPTLGAPRLQLPPAGVLVSQQVGSSKPVFDVVISTATSKQSSSGKDGAAAAANGSPSRKQPTWDQQVIITSSDPKRLKELSDLFTAQLRSTGAAASGPASKKLLGVGSSVELADTAQVVLLAAKRMRDARATQTATH